ncbi:MAG: ATP-binding cassette domain-containing protein [Gammaproteobacteria bacterium]|nr:ATP-binding cassette domain-containing protein [Gammaproteobacteria bacterium]
MRKAENNSSIRVRGARENNLQNVDVDFDDAHGAGFDDAHGVGCDDAHGVDCDDAYDVGFDDALTAVTGVSGSGKSSLVFDVVHHEARRRFFEVYAPPSRGHRLSPAAVASIDGLRPSVAIGQNLLNRNPASTVATAIGLHPILRILYARFGTRRCADCLAPLTLTSEDDLVRRLVSRSKAERLEVRATLVRDSIGSHATLLASLRDEFGADSVVLDDAPLGAPADPASPHDIQVVLTRTDTRLRVKQAREIYARARALGADEVELVAKVPKVMQVRQRLSVSPVCAQCGTWFAALTPTHFKEPCPYCEGRGCERCRGSGLHPNACAVTWQDRTLNEMLGRSVDDTRSWLRGASGVSEESWPASAKRIKVELARRLDALQSVGLGYLALDRPAPSLSRGENQRVRIAVVLTSQLEGMLHVLDEPTVGLHAADVEGVVDALETLRGPVIVVEHDRMAVARADRVIDMGPGAGPHGGKVIFDGSPEALWSAPTPTGLAFSTPPLTERANAGPPEVFLTIRGARLRTLRGIDVPLARGRMNVISGVSGSGKSTLVEDVLVESLARGTAVGCEKIEGFEGTALLIDQSPIGRNPRSNPATYTKLADVIRDGFAAATDLTASHFTFNRKEGACPECEGLGAIEIKMRYLPSTWVQCEACEGRRFSEAVLNRRVAFGGVDLAISDVFDASVDEAAFLIHRDGPFTETKRRAARRILTALSDVGLGYVKLGQPSPTLSGGEAQRVKLARHLGGARLADKLIVLDEPTAGLHPTDVVKLLEIFDRLTASGATLVVVEHNLDVIRHSAWVVDLGPGSGPDGGGLLYAGTPTGLLSCAASATAEALKRDRGLRPVKRKRRRTAKLDHVRIRKAGAHNLRDVDVDIPHGRLTVVTGVSGSGKSSLVRDVLEVEARRRFLESLSMYERQSMQEGAEAAVEDLSGLGVTIPLRGDARFHNPRETVGAATELSPAVAVLLARLGRRRCPSCNALMKAETRGWRCKPCAVLEPALQPRHFIPTIYGSACTRCHGVGTLREPAVEKLIVAPDKPLCAGAMYSPGFYPQGFFGKPFNSGYDILQTLAGKFGFDPFETPWRDMPEAGRQAFLFGPEDPFDVTYESRKGRVTVRSTVFRGFFGVVREWDLGGTYTTARACPACNGGKLRPEYLAVALQGRNMATLSRMPLADLGGWLDSVRVPARERMLAEPALAKAKVRVDLLDRLGLGYLHLFRTTASLSAGEAQRLQLARILAGGLSGLTVLLDEPTQGMHPREVDALVDALLQITDLGNTAIVVEHDLSVIRRAHHLIDMGPGPGAAGGRVVAVGKPAEVAGQPTPTGRALAGSRRVTAPNRREPSGWLVVKGARENNLKQIDARLPLGVLTGICGVSGSGKSTLIMDTLARVVAPKKHTTSVARENIEPGAHDAILGAPRRSVLLDQAREGVVSPASFLGVKTALQRAYGNSAGAKVSGITPEMLSTRCAECNGSGTQTIDMGFLPNLHPVCEVCGGTGYVAELWDLELRGHALPALMTMTVDQVYDLWRDEDTIARPLRRARDVGLGYLVMQQPARALSGGEVQRLRIAKEFAHKRGQSTLYLLDEPTLGQHVEDIERLVGVLRRLVEEGASVVVVEHSPEFLAACDYLVELGPVGGPGGGRIVGEGTPEHLASLATPTAPYLAAALAS